MVCCLNLVLYYHVHGLDLTLLMKSQKCTVWFIREKLERSSFMETSNNFTPIKNYLQPAVEGFRIIIIISEISIELRYT